MEISNIPVAFSLRPAVAADETTIRRMIAQVNINPMGLDWKRFILAIDPTGIMIGCGQVKPHGDGSFELASIAVLPEWRGKGVARAIIEHLLQEHPSRLYLTCRSELEPLYQKFGFQTIMMEAMPPYFRRISRIVNIMNRLSRRRIRLLVMRRN